MSSVDILQNWHKYKTLIAAGATAFAGLGALTYYFLKPKLKTIPRVPVDLNNQSAAIDGKVSSHVLSPPHKVSRVNQPERSPTFPLNRNWNKYLESINNLANFGDINKPRIIKCYTSLMVIKNCFEE